MRGVWYGVMAQAILALPVSTQLSAQRAIAASANGESTQMITHTQGVTLSMQAIPVESAVVAIARQSKLRLQYRDDVFTGVGKKVSLSLDNVPVEEAFSRVFLGTSLRAVVIGRNFVNIERDPNAAAPVEQGIIVGKVRDPQGKPLSGVTIRRGTDATAAVTGTDGTFRIEVPGGTHQLSLRLIGFARQSKDVTVEAGKTVTVEIVMEPSANVLGEVVVTGTVVATERKAIPTPITVIDAEEIERRGITRIDQLFRGEIPGLLAMEVGMNAYEMNIREIRDGLVYNTPNTAGASVTKMYSRGASSLDAKPNPIKTYVDGVELLDASYLGTIDPQSIERIEIVTGPQAATIYGSGALGGVMQVFTKKGSGGTGPDVTAQLRYGVLESNVSPKGAPSHHHTLMVSGGSGPALSYSLNFSHVYTGQWAPALFSRSYGGALGATHTNGALRFSGSVSITNGSNGTLAIAANGSPYVRSRVAQGEWNCGNVANGIASCGSYLQTSQRVSDRTNQALSVNIDYQMNQKVQHQATIGRVQNNFELNPMGPQFGTPKDTMFSYGSNSGSRTTASYNTSILSLIPHLGTSALTVGVNGGWGKNFLTTGTASSDNAPSWTTSTVSRVLDDRTWGGFGSWRLGIAEQVFITVGLRAERNRAYGGLRQTDWTPTSGIAYTIEHGDVSVKLLGSYGRATRAPLASQSRELEFAYTSINMDPSRYVEQFANPYLAPEYEAGPQGGIEVYYGNISSFTINHYSQRVTNLLSREIVDSIARVYLPFPELIYYGRQYQWQNIAKIRKHGWEATGAVNIGSLMFRGAYSWNDSRVDELGPQYTGSLYPGQSFLLIPTHIGSATIGYVSGATSVTLVTNYLGTRLVGALALPVEISWGYANRLLMYIPRSSGLFGTFRKSGYVKSDLSVQHRLTGWISATLNVTNLGNSFADDNENSLAPALGRQTMFGMSLRY